MDILVAKDGVIVAIEERIEFGVWEDEPDIEKWKLSETMYMLDNELTLVTDVEAPDFVKPYRYCYGEAGFYKNPKWVEPFDPENEITQLRKQITELQLALCELAEMQLGGNL